MFWGLRSFSITSPLLRSSFSPPPNKPPKLEQPQKSLPGNRRNAKVQKKQRPTKGNLSNFTKRQTYISNKKHQNKGNKNNNNYNDVWTHIFLGCLFGSCFFCFVCCWDPLQVLKQTEDLTLILQCNKMKTMRATKAANRSLKITRVDEL